MLDFDTPIPLPRRRTGRVGAMRMHSFYFYLRSPFHNQNAPLSMRLSSGDPLSAYISWMNPSQGRDDHSLNNHKRAFHRGDYEGI
jgi:hypothetical protein